MNDIRKGESGAVSLFVVIFAMLLITVATVSFLRLMVTDQNQASQMDLSRSAYDSSMAGVEDAKRALLRYKKMCAEEGPAACANLARQWRDGGCNAALVTGGLVQSGSETGGSNGRPGEIRIQQSSTNDRQLDQAYTCVKIELDTDDYTGTLSPSTSQIVPLISSAPFDTVTVSWFSRDDVTSAAINLPSTGAGGQGLNEQSAWPVNRPSVLRAQLMQFGTNFTLGDFDTVNAAGQSNSNTLFLYPTSTVTSATHEFSTKDARAPASTRITPQDQSNDTPLPVRCVSNLVSSGGGYACTTNLILPTPIGGGDRTAYLRLTSFYNAAHYQVTLRSGSNTVVQFTGVQPAIDSTGRANDAFRRVVTRVGLVDTAFPYPEAAVDLTGSFCKDFAVTNTNYLAGTCTP